MDIRIKDQAVALLLAAALGLGIGLLYDLLRPARHRAGRLLAMGLDGCFALAAGLGIFSFAMTADNGRLGTWELVSALLGFLLYMYGFSGFILPVLERIFQTLGKANRTVKKTIKKFQVSRKKLFPKIRECFIIKKKSL